MSTAHRVSILSTLVVIMSLAMYACTPGAESLPGAAEMRFKPGFYQGDLSGDITESWAGVTETTNTTLPQEMYINKYGHFMNLDGTQAQTGQRGTIVTGIFPGYSVHVDRYIAMPEKILYDISVSGSMNDPDTNKMVYLTGTITSVITYTPEGKLSVVRTINIVDKNNYNNNMTGTLTGTLTWQSDIVW